MQKQPAQQQAQLSAQQPVNPNQITVAQILDLTRQGVHEDVIVDRIRLTNSRYNLSQADVDYLKQNNVSQKVLMEMQGF
jgi:hypothetical protein